MGRVAVLAKKKIVLGMALVALLSAGGLSARQLRGRLFLGQDLQLYLQEDESILTNVLRTICLVNSEIPIIKLSAIAVTRDTVFIGTDRKLYHRTGGPSDATYYRIGDARDLSDIRVQGEVRFHERRDSLQPFATGSLLGRLDVTLSGSAKPIEGDAPLSTVRYWLQELQREYDLRLSGDLHHNNVIMILNALPGTLPASGDAPPAQFENLKHLRTHVLHEEYEYPEPLNALLRDLLRRVKHELMDAEPGTVTDTTRLLNVYEDLLERVKAAE